MKKQIRWRSEGTRNNSVYCVCMRVSLSSSEFTSFDVYSSELCLYTDCTIDVQTSYDGIFATFYSVGVFYWEINTQSGTMSGFSEKLGQVRRQIPVDEWGELLIKLKCNEVTENHDMILTKDEFCRRSSTNLPSAISYKYCMNPQAFHNSLMLFLVALPPFILLS